MPPASSRAVLARHLGEAYTPPEEKNGYAPGWLRTIEYAVTNSNWCGVGNPPDVWANVCVRDQQDGACRRHDMCGVVEKLPHPMIGLAIACACDRDLWVASTAAIEKTLYAEDSGWPCVDCTFEHGLDKPCTVTFKFQEKYVDVYEDWPHLYKTETMDGCSIHNLTCNQCSPPLPPPTPPPLPPLYPLFMFASLLGTNGSSLGWIGRENVYRFSEAMDLTDELATLPQWLREETSPAELTTRPYAPLMLALLAPALLLAAVAFRRRRTRTWEGAAVPGGLL